LRRCHLNEHKQISRAPDTLNASTRLSRFAKPSFVIVSMSPASKKLFAKVVRREIRSRAEVGEDGHPCKLTINYNAAPRECETLRRRCGDHLLIRRRERDEYTHRQEGDHSRSVASSSAMAGFSRGAFSDFGLNSPRSIITAL
jgi:hypothetical protein